MARYRKGKKEIRDTFVRRKVLEYTINLINSSLMDSSTERVVDYLIELIDLNQFKTLINKSKGKSTKLKDCADFDDLVASLGRTKIINTVKTDILKYLENELSNINEVTPTDKKLISIKKTFQLNDIEIEILSLSYTLECSPILNTSFGSIVDLTEPYEFWIYGNEVLNIDQHTFHDSIQSGKLDECGLMEIDGSISHATWVETYLIGIKPNLKTQFYQKYEGPCVDLESHFLEEIEVDVLNQFLTNNQGANILLYGEPGTGKTELAKSLAKYLKKNLCVVAIKDTEFIGQARPALVATCNLIDPSNSIILMDDSDQVLNTAGSYFRFGERTSKNWIHEFLEKTKHNIIWTVNDTDYVEPSTMRRFSYSKKFKPFNLKKRIQVFKICIARAGIDSLFNEDEIVGLASKYPINASGISDVIKNLELNNVTDKTTAFNRLHEIIKKHHTAITGKESKRGLNVITQNYNLDILNTSESLNEVVCALQRIAGDSHLTKKNSNILLHGHPGTGKTEFVKYLGNTLHKEITLKRASDLISCYVGETEKAISEVFDEEERNETILFLDEADSFFLPRESARNSWEKTKTNELLTQMENFTGIFICATNFLKGLDQAVLRRFKWKIEFKPLTGEGCLEMYKSILSPLSNAESTSVEDVEIKGLLNLTPGDFSVVADKLSYLDDKKITHEYLIKLLKQEMTYKTTKNRVGFAV